MDIATLLLRLGFNLKDAGTETVKLRICYFNNPDGTVRWCWPASSRNPLFLKFYHISGWKSRLFSLVTRGIFTLHLESLFFRIVSFTVSKNNNASALLSLNAEWAAFTGTRGPNRKAILYMADRGSEAFIKIAVDEYVSELLRNEYITLDWLSKANRITFSYPIVKAYEPGIIKLTDVAGTGNRIEKFSSAHKRTLLELRNETSFPARLNSLNIWRITRQRLELLKKHTDERIPAGMLRKLDLLISQTEVYRYIDVCLSHGDFTPWNMYLKNDGSLAIYDWELSQPEMPFGYDAFHFVIQNGILIQRLSWSQIRQEIENVLFQKNDLLGSYPQDQQLEYLRLYLIINTVYYLTIYQQQNEWHTQVSWLINTWNEAMSTLLVNKRSHRELMIMDTIDFLRNKKYAILKYHNGFPEKLSALSDMDFCIERSHYSDISKFLANHALISHRKMLKKSFMASEHLVLTDGSMLNMDFIWQIKRKSLEMMNAKDLLKRASKNEYDVKVPAPLDDARYVGLFYALNNADLPSKYIHYQQILEQSDVREDYLLSNYFYCKLHRKAIIKALNYRPSNSGFNKLVNIVSYWIDVLKEMVGSRGMVITFSGVDGAGKSTVIENLQMRIEKQFRKRVVVLRHRPSLLPILSSWKKGKYVAEQEAASTLPRQGKNKSAISSIMRFLYYYFDYLVGQLYVKIKYVLRGNIVLYDRYYFDFINDSRRSNVDLPSSITRLGYSLILEPDLNFFLYARPELILSRKKELDQVTIEELTQKYLTLFCRLNKKRKDNRYISIENIELGVTLEQIMARII